MESLCLVIQIARKTFTHEGQDLCQTRTYIIRFSEEIISFNYDDDEKNT